MRGCRSAGALGTLGAAVILVLVVGCSGGSPPAAPASTPAGSSADASGGAAVPCTASTLSVTVGASEGAASAPLLFRNTGSRPCITRGFPRVSYVTALGGAQVGRSAERDGAPGGAVRLAPGEAATANLTMAKADSFPTGVCQPTPVWGLRVYPPGQPAPIFVPMSGTGCAGNPPGPQLRISTIASGGPS